MQRTPHPLLILLLLAALALPGCGRPAATAGAGRAARRIVALAPSITEILFALGASRQVVGVTSSCDYPPDARRLPRVGDVNLDYERIVALKPDVVVAEAITRADNVRRLRSLGLRVVDVHSATLEDYRATVETLGQLTGERTAAARLVHELDEALAQMRARTAGLPRNRRPRVFVEIWDRPLMTVGGGTFIDEMVHLVGGANVFADERKAFPTVDPETVVARDPQVVILTTSSERAFMARPGFASLTAVRQRNVHHVDPDVLVRPSPRLAEGIRVLARYITPLAGATTGPGGSRAGRP